MYKRFRQAVCGAALLVLPWGCAGPGIGLDAVPMPGAEMVMEIDPQAMRSEPFWGEVQSLSARHTGGMGDSGFQRLATVRQVLDRAGLESEDLLEIRAAARFAPGGITAVSGFRLATPVPPETVAEAVGALAAEAGRAIDVGEIPHPGGSVLRISAPGDPAAAIGFTRDHRVLYTGPEQEVLAIMDRLEAGRAAEVLPEMERIRSLVDPASQAWLAFVVSPRHRELVAGAVREGGPLVPRGLAESLEAWRSGMAEARAGDDLEVRVNWYFESEDRAQAFQESVGGLTELFKGLVILAGGGKPVDAVNGMTWSRTESTVRLDLAVSQADLLTLEEMYELQFAE